MSSSHKGKSKSTKTATLTLGALGVVYGDIGTSPIYAFNESVHAGGYSRAEILGVLSLVFWTLMAVVTIKYLTVVLRADNRGEGGILALFALMPNRIRDARKGAYGFVIFLMLMAAAFIFADGLLTPAISVVSAVEGIKTVNTDLSFLIVPITVIILAALFTFQFKGSQKIGALFGPVMVIWFATIGFLGISQISQNTDSLVALNPVYAMSFIGSHGLHTLVVMSSVILAVTGAEALYADLGHFGKGPIRLGWYSLVGPALVLSYFGQGALVLRDPSSIGNSFFGMVPSGLPSILLLLLTTLATIIASQALISGVASIASQAIQLGLLPRLKVRHTNEEHRGQIYVPLVNALLAAGSIALVLIFESSAALAGAYTFAIAGTMLITTLALYFVAKERWKISKYISYPVLALFAVMDLAFLISTSTKVATGAWLPMLIGFCLGSMMWIWRKGRFELNHRLVETSMTWSSIKRMRTQKKVALTENVGIYLSAVTDAVPQALEQQISVLGSMPKKIIVVTIESVDNPKSHATPEFTKVNDFLATVKLESGFMEQRNIPRALRSKAIADHFDEREAVYFVTDRTLLPNDKTGLNRLEEIIFATLHRNAADPAKYFNLPAHRVITFDVAVDI
ncbi:MAG: KUP/HAK/KT family potassium transporter [Actinomycetales bacterium]|nr:KUP/HAK/KT family potassium transporter [Actinomycetales bacterium]